jgi:predicted nucleic acid-binding protein
VRIIVADTGPVHYLALIGQSQVLPALFEKVIIPPVGRDELSAGVQPSADSLVAAGRLERPTYGL